jgi:hypothetical protein
MAPNGMGGPPATSIQARAGVGELTRQLRQDARVGIGISELDAQVDHPSAAGHLGDQLGVSAGVGHGRHSLDQAVQEWSTTHIGELPAVIQLPQHRHGIGRLAAVGQPQDGPPNGPMGRPVEVGLLEHGGDVGQQPPGSQDCPEDRFLGLQVVGWRPVGVRHRSEPSSGRGPALCFVGHRRGLRGLLPRRGDAGVGRR